jgi:hypothetical protein
MAMMIEIDDRAAASLRNLQRQATERGLPLHEYLDLLGEIGANALEAPRGELTEEELEAIFDELARLPPPPGSLPDDFSRADIYFDHD